MSVNVDRDYVRNPDGSIEPRPGINSNIVPHGYARHGDGRIVPESPRTRERVANDRRATLEFHRATGR